MKKIYIVALVAIALGVFLIANSAKDVTTYADFSAAEPGNRVKIVGQLSKEKPMIYDPNVDVNLFTFFMKDDNGVEKKVIYTKGKPQDFEMSESLVVTGKLKDDVFVSDEILMKCPSKYKGEEELINAQNAG